MSELVPALKDTLFSPTYEIVAEYAEIGIDALLDNEVLKGMNEARFSNIFIEKRASSCPQSLEKSRLFSYPLLMSEGENSQNVKRIFLRKVVI